MHTAHQPGAAPADGPLTVRLRPPARGKGRTGPGGWPLCLAAAAVLTFGCGYAFALSGGGTAPRRVEGKPAAVDRTPLRTPDGLLAVGSHAPEFTLPDMGGKSIALADLLERPLVLYFYPMDETPGCTAQACGFRDDSAQFDSIGVRVVGISTDAPTSHRAFATRHHLPFTLLSDSLGTVSRLYGVAYDIDMSGAKRTIARQVTYLIDSNGLVRHVWPKVDPTGSSVEVLAFLKQNAALLKR